MQGFTNQIAHGRIQTNVYGHPKVLSQLLGFQESAFPEQGEINGNSSRDQLATGQNVAQTGVPEQLLLLTQEPSQEPALPRCCNWLLSVNTCQYTTVRQKA